MSNVKNVKNNECDIDIVAVRGEPINNVIMARIIKVISVSGWLTHLQTTRFTIISKNSVDRRSIVIF